MIRTTATRAGLAAGVLAALGWAGCEKRPDTFRMTDEEEVRSLESVKPRYKAADRTPLEAEAPADARPRPVLPRTVTYTVRPGDTLFGIAGRLLGDGRRWKELVDANPGLDPQAMKVGQVLKIPSR